LRLYLSRFGFERIKSSIGADNIFYLALYGSLMQGFDGLIESGAENKIILVGKCKVAGRIFDLGDYPGLVSGDGSVCAELYKVVDDNVIRDLDKFERFDPRDRISSLFVRRCVRCKTSDNRFFDAWVYFYNQDVLGHEPILSGDWKSYIALK
jgi:gamma-glutamylcyclotransferase (GGCT)/AIG2-like uncharacterized protein YtfP